MKNGGKVEISGLNTAEIATLSDGEKRDLLAAAQAGDKAARDRLILGNLRLVLSVIRRFSSRNENPDDPFQGGGIGLIKEWIAQDFPLSSQDLAGKVLLKYLKAVMDIVPEQKQDRSRGRKEKEKEKEYEIQRH